MADETQKPSLIQEVLGSRITKLVLWGTICIGIVGVTFAFIALKTNDEDKVKLAFSIIQYIFGALLPLWGTWIGTILAYYYSKQNFESANNSVRQLVDKITSEKKLETVKAKDVMIPLDKLILQTMASTEDLSKFKLQADCIDFVKTNNIKRIIILDENSCAKFVIHKSLIGEFLMDNPATDTNTFALLGMYTLGVWKDRFDNSVKFIPEDANLLVAKNIMEKYKTCQDVFLTKTGNAAEPIIGWITNVTISENSIV